MTTAAAEPQHITALRKATDIRLARARLGREIHALPERESAAAAARVVLDPPAALLTLPLYDLLSIHVRRYGHRRALRILRPENISERRELGQLTDRQRAAVAACLAPQEDHHADDHTADALADAAACSA